MEFECDTNSRAQNENGAADETWYVFMGKDYEGPFTSEGLTELVKGGAISTNALIWRVGDERWSEISDVEPFSAFQKAMPRVSIRQKTDSKANSRDDVESDRYETTFVDYAPDPGCVDSTVVRQSREQAWKSFYEQQGVRKKEPRGNRHGARILGKRLRPFNLIDHDRIAAQEKLKKEIRRRLSASPFGRIADDIRKYSSPGFVVVSRLLSHCGSHVSNFLCQFPVFRRLKGKWRSATVRWKVKGLIYFKAAGILATGLLLVHLTGAFVGSANSPLALEDISGDERNELESAINTSYLRHGAVGALAVSMFDPYAPVIFVGSNLDDNKQLIVRVEGIPDTLVDQFKVSVQSSVIIKQGLSKSPVLRQAGGAQFPLGAYKVILTCPGCDPRGKVLAEKKFVVGPGLSDQDYRSRLLVYHGRLQNQARDELAELKQLTETIGGQLDETDSAFRRVLGSAAIGEKWGAFHDRWTSLEDQIDSLVLRWSPEALDGGFYYSPMYSDLKRLVERVQRLHAEQARYALDRSHGANRDLAHEASLFADAANVRTQLKAIQARVREVSNRGPSTSGMPARI